MLRRSHKKTKKGSKCEECRRRHIRCDQQRPSCINCLNSDRTCTYRPTHQPRAVEASPSWPPAVSPDGKEAPQGLPSLSTIPAQTVGDPLVDIGHLRLFHHFIQGSFLFIDRDVAFTDQLKKTALSSAFSHPYLMHGILAFAALHISTQAAPETASHYLDQSTKLQTWALANFNPVPSDPDQGTCVALFLFSSLTCVHGLADIALLDLEPEPFFIRFGHYFGLQRGVRAIVGDHWSRLEESEIRDLLQWCEPLSTRKGRGSQCDCVRQLVAQSTDMSPAATEACYFAIEQLQCILDGRGSHREMPVQCVYFALAWPFLIPEKMVDLLVLRRPPALVILAYYGAALDYYRELWMVGSAGKQIVHAVSRHLGSGWTSWLRWPCEIVNIEAI